MVAKTQSNKYSSCSASAYPKHREVAAVILGAVLFMHAWQLFGLSHPKTTGIVGAVGAITLTSLVAW